ncbi:hypothetical protein GGI43DRAFT_385906 [Trichoderma evansii]
MDFTNAICIILPIFLCVSIMLCLVFFTIRATAHDDMPPREYSNNNASPYPEMVLDEATSPDYLSMRTHKDPRRKTMNIRDIFLRDERVYVGDEESDMQPLLPGELYDDPLEQPASNHVAKGKVIQVTHAHKHITKPLEHFQEK